MINGDANRVSYDPKIMQELLDQPGVRENASAMTPGMLDWFKELLVSEGIYARYVKEREAKAEEAKVKGKKRNRHG